ncbi:MAG: biotin carboxylase N-terminal domain-containing protein, partial [Candidatus Puniceispirillaceae bacterium]
MFQKILIANRGEIACRILKTAKRMNIQTVAVYSDADAGTPHVRLADEAYHIGGAASADSYLRGDKIIEAAKQSGAEAIHPGFGFLSENSDFVAAVEAAGLVFIGPDSHAIEVMGDKIESKKWAV